MHKRKQARPLYRFLASIDRGDRRYEAGEICELNWPNIDDVLAWGVIERVDGKEEDEYLPFSDAPVPELEQEGG